MSSSSRDETVSPSSSNPDRRDVDIDLEDDDCLSDIGSEVSDPSQLEDIDPGSDAKSAGSPQPNPLITNNPFLPPHLQHPVKIGRQTLGAATDLVRPLPLSFPVPPPHPTNPHAAPAGGGGGGGGIVIVPPPPSALSLPHQPAPTTPQLLLPSSNQQQPSSSNKSGPGSTTSSSSSSASISSSSSPPQQQHQHPEGSPASPQSSPPMHHQRPLFKPHELALSPNSRATPASATAFRPAGTAADHHPTLLQPHPTRPDRSPLPDRRCSSSPLPPPPSSYPPDIGLVKREPHPAFNPHHEMLSQFAAARAEFMSREVAAGREFDLHDRNVAMSFKPRDLRLEYCKSHELVGQNFAKAHEQFTQEALNNYARQNGVLGSAS